MTKLCTVVLLVAGLFAGCASTPHYGRLTTGGGFSTVKASNEDDSLRLDGGHVALRGEVAAQSDISENLHAGLRVDLRGRDVSEDGLGDEGLGTADIEAGELAASIVLRRYLPVSETVRPFFEGSIGYAHDFADMRAEAPQTFGSFAMRDDKGGLLYGAGIGTEIGSRDNHAILQLDWTRRSIEDGEFDFNIDDVTLFVGWGFKF